jgi:hypothetical protein
LLSNLFLFDCSGEFFAEGHVSYTDVFKFNIEFVGSFE